MNQLISSALAASFLLAAAHSPAHAIDSAALEFGTGNRTQFVRGSLQWNFQRALYESERLAIKGYWDLSLSQWRKCVCCARSNGLANALWRTDFAHTKTCV